MTETTEERFSRNIGAVTPQEQKKLGESRVFIAGCGGTGGYIIEHLARIGVGEIICADDGRFETRDLNRQILADIYTLGREKSECARERAARVRPEANINALNAHICESNIKDMISGCDLAVDALDNIKTRRILFDACRQNLIPLIHAAVRGWLIQAAFVPPGGALYDLLYPEYLENASEKFIDGVMSFAPGMAASLQAALAVRWLCGRGCDADLHIYNMQTMDYSRIKL